MGLSVRYLRQAYMPSLSCPLQSKNLMNLEKFTWLEIPKIENSKCKIKFFMNYEKFTWQEIPKIRIKSQKEKFHKMRTITRKVLNWIVHKLTMLFKPLLQRKYFMNHEKFTWLEIPKIKTSIYESFINYLLFINYLHQTLTYWSKYKNFISYFLIINYLIKLLLPDPSTRCASCG